MEKILITILFFFAIFAPAASAQSPGEKLLKQQTEDRIQRIVAHSPAVTGLAVVDLTKGETVFSINKDMSFPQASAIKIPILMEVFRQAHEKKFMLSDQYSIQADEVVGGTGIIKSMEGPVSLSIRNISVLMMAVSDNTATNILIDLVGMDNINANLRSLGLRTTTLQRKMMDIEASARGKENLSTPAEAAQILQLLYEGKFINKEVSSDIISFLNKPSRQDSRLAAGIPDNVSIAFKPGELSGVSTEWAIVQLPERPYAIAIMENYKWGSKMGSVMESISKVLYQYFWRMGNSTRYGVYRDPSLIRK